MISIDTLRADRLGAYGYARPTSPHLDALAARGRRYETVIAESNWTLPSHVTLFTGMRPRVHGVDSPGRKLAAHVATLPVLLHEHGFRTLGVTGGLFVSQRYGFERGFDTFGDVGGPLAQAVDRMAHQIEVLPEGDRWFAFFHTYEVHCPYEPPADQAGRFDRPATSDPIELRGRCGNSHFNAMALSERQAAFISDRYDAGIHYADDRIGHLLKRLGEAGRLDDTLVAVVSDHGEELFEHGRIGHRETVFIESLRVPWILAGPGIEVEVVEEPLGLADILPVLLAALGLPSTPPTPPKVSLGSGPGTPAPGDRFSRNEWGESLSSLVSGPHHAIYQQRSQAFLLFDWRADPREQEDLAGRDVALDRSLQERLFADLIWRGPRNFVDVEPPESAEVERLRALGYVE